MAFNKFGIVAISLMVSAPVFAAVTITTPEEIVLLAINDQEVNSGLFRTSKNDYKVDAGQASFSVRYQQYFRHLDGEHDIVKSGVVTIAAPNLLDGKTYTLKPVNVPNEYEAAKKYAEQPTIALYDQNKKLVVEQTGANNEPKAWFGGRIFDFTKSNKPSGNQPAAVYGSSSTAVQASAAQSSAATAATDVQYAMPARSADQQLIQIWQSASKAERQRFMTWLANQ